MPLDEAYIMPEAVARLQEKVVLEREEPRFIRRARGGWFADFGTDAFGTLEIEAEQPAAAEIEVRLGEVLGQDGSIYKPPPRSPECSRRFRSLLLSLKKGRRLYRLKLPVPRAGDAYQSKGYDCAGSAAVRCPRHTGELMPFRYCEITGRKGTPGSIRVRRLTAHLPFDDEASDFRCSDTRLSSVWSLCKHTVRSMTFLGIYVDGDRERLPYEGDALIQQLSHFCADSSFAASGALLDWFFEKGTTWCYEWVLSLPVLAARHYLYSGDAAPLARHYGKLRRTSLCELSRKDGLIETGTDLTSHPLVEELRPGTGFFRDVVDWPPNMRDGYDIGKVNTAANSFRFSALRALGCISAALGKESESREYFSRAEKVRRSMMRVLFDRKTGLFVDSEGSAHSSLHACMYPAGHGVIRRPEGTPLSVFLRKKGMACSVFGSQFLLDALYASGEPDAALGLMHSRGRRSWLNMMREGATMTMECWSDELKPNQSWNHGWGTAPLNVITRRLMGIRPAEPGFAKALIAPSPGRLSSAAIKAPTARGPVAVSFEKRGREIFWNLEIPETMNVDFILPKGTRGVETEGRTAGRRRIFPGLEAGAYSFSSVEPDGAPPS